MYTHRSFNKNQLCQSLMATINPYIIFLVIMVMATTTTTTTMMMMMMMMVMMSIGFFIEIFDELYRNN